MFFLQNKIEKTINLKLEILVKLEIFQWWNITLQEKSEGLGLALDRILESVKYDHANYKEVIDTRDDEVN